MNKLANTAVAVLSLTALAACGGPSASFDYQTASEERQQKYLDGIANGFKTGFRFTAGNRAELSRLEADASIDMVSITIQYKDDRMEKASGEQIGQMKQLLLKYSCKNAQKSKMLEQGVTMRIRMKRPSGSQMTGFDIDEEGCQGYVT